jgi:hypothetical protein
VAVAVTERLAPRTANVEMRSPFGLLLPFLLGGGACSAAAFAEGAPETWKRVVLVELFTSLGCSSCPAADELLRELPRLGFTRDKVVPLAYHVDYWDGLGWKDPFASTAFTKRQDWYARTGALRSPEGQVGLTGLYTPQMIVGGAVHFSGQRRSMALSEIRRAASQPAPFNLEATASINGQEIVVDVRAVPRSSRGSVQEWGLVVALTQKAARTRVSQGENGGEVLQEAAIVRALSEAHPLPSPPGGPLRTTLSRPPGLKWADLGVAAFVQSRDTGEVAGVLAIAVPSP